MSDKTELQNIIGIQADRIFDLEERIEALEAALREKDLLKHLSENPIERMALDRIEALEKALRLAHEWLDPTEIPDADYCIIRAALASETDKGIPMNALVFIAPHERHEAIEAYRDRLTAEQIDGIEEAPEGAIVQLNFGIQGTRVIIIEEG